MTWTCKCTTVNEDHWKMCNGCGADRPAGLSDMGMEALEAFNAGRRAIHAVEYEPASFRSAEVTRTEAFAFWKAARAPLEAENKALRERVSCLQSELTFAAELLGTADPTAKAANLETSGDLLKRLARDESSIIREGAVYGLDIQAQLAQAQKPAEAKGLPAVGEHVEVSSLDPVHGHMKATVKCHLIYQGRPAFEVNEMMGIFTCDDGPELWRRIPAQTSREHSASTPTAAPDGVTTENMGKVARYVWGDDGESHRPGTGGWCAFDVAAYAAKADIRANLARAEKRSADRIAELEDRLNNAYGREVSMQKLVDIWRERLGMRDAEVKRLTAELAKAKGAR